MAADPNDVERAETGLLSVEIKQEKGESGNAKHAILSSETSGSKNKPSINKAITEPLISTMDEIKNESDIACQTLKGNAIDEVSDESEFTTTGTSNKVPKEIKFNAVQLGELSNNNIRKKVGLSVATESLSNAGVISSVLDAINRSLNIDSLGYSVIENEPSERDNYISKDDLKRLEDIPETLTTFGVGHPIASKDRSNHSESDLSDIEGSVEDEEDSLKCKVCRKIFEDDEQLDLHLKVSQVDKTFKCCACGKCFRDNSQLNVHTRTHTGEQPYECRECGKKFSINGNLSKHMRVHTGERRFKCDICEKKFTQFAHLEDHIKTHSGDKPYQCDICMSAFKTKARLRKHVKCHQEERLSKRSLRCPICDKVLKNMRQLIDHVKSHSEVDSEEPFQCLICGKSYRTLFYLQSHQKLHSGIRSYQCNLCDKVFTTSSQLRRHINSHAGIKPFSCDLCERSFPSTQNLKRHMLTHTGIKPYTCNVCSKGFLTVENLNRHMRIHTGEKPYSCDICGKSFAHSTTVKEHRRTHTGDKPFGCSVCCRKFTTSKMLFKHIRQRHPECSEYYNKITSMPPNTLARRDALNLMQQEFDQMMSQEHQDVDAQLASVKPETMEIDEERSSSEQDSQDGSNSSKVTQTDVKGDRTPKLGRRRLPDGVKMDVEKIDVPDRIEAEKLSCDICHKTFKSSAKLVNHKSSHTKNKTKPYTCTICGKGSNTLESLNKHIDRHEKLAVDQSKKIVENIPKSLKPFKCSTCSNSFVSKLRLSNHIKKKHGGNGEIVEVKACEVPVSETEVSMAPIKIKIEDGGDPNNFVNVKTFIDLDTTTPHFCDICSNKFPSFELLRIHKESHIEQKPFQYDQQQDFNQSFPSYSHLWTSTSHSLFQCNVCNESFSSANLLQQHFWMQHYDLKIRRPDEYMVPSDNFIDCDRDVKPDLSSLYLGCNIKAENTDSCS